MLYLEQVVRRLRAALAVRRLQMWITSDAYHHVRLLRQKAATTVVCGAFRLLAHRRVQRLQQRRDAVAQAGPSLGALSSAERGVPRCSVQRRAPPPSARGE